MGGAEKVKSSQVKMEMGCKQASKPASLNRHGDCARASRGANRRSGALIASGATVARPLLTEVSRRTSACATSSARAQVSP